MFDVIVVGGGFAGVTAAREAALQGRSVLLLEARERLGGRTWRSDWDGQEIEYGGQWVHWHQPNTFSEITRAGLAIELGAEADHVGWYVGEDRRSATMDERNAIAARGWDRFVEGVDEALPMPHDPLYAIDKLATFDRLTMSERIDQLDISRRSVMSCGPSSSPWPTAHWTMPERWPCFGGTRCRGTASS